ncbi:hypothetical protein Mapa_011076 [Marchantia paleacea]|nr:hypothetical protein Mapa_011076 [Marchantia paleacea]
MRIEEWRVKCGGTKGQDSGEARIGTGGQGEGRQAAIKSGDRAVSAGLWSCSGTYTDVEEACAG